MKRFEGKNAIVTGGGSGIGRAISLRLASEGAALAIHDVSAENAAATVSEIVNMGGIARSYLVDSANDMEVEKAVVATISDMGSVQVLICNAGVNLYKEVFDFTKEEWDRIIAVNLTGPWNYCRHVGKQMAKDGGGSIVIISSTGAFRASYLRAPYMASKGGAHNLTKALALDFAKFNIRVNDVAPGFTETSMTRPRPGHASESMVASITPLRRKGKPEEQAAAVAFLASDDASYMTGATIIVDGGMTVGTTVGLPIHMEPDIGAELSWLKR